MNTLILTLLRHDARSWWYHQTLRERGQVAEARKRERTSIRSAVRLLRLRPEEHLHRSRFVAFDRAENPSTLCSSGIHPGEWAAFHLVHGWMKCFEPVPNLRRAETSTAPARR